MSRAEDSCSSSSVTLNRAYQLVNTFDNKKQAVLNKYEGPEEFRDLYRHLGQQDGKQKQAGLTLQKQPLHMEEVDHQIQEIGILAVKEVKYLTDEEWEIWNKNKLSSDLKQQDLMQLMLSQGLQNQKPYEQEWRHKLAQERKRDAKGKFLSKGLSAPKQKKKPIKKKRGRKSNQQAVKIDPQSNKS